MTTWSRRSGTCPGRCSTASPSSPPLVTWNQLYWIFEMYLVLIRPLAGTYFENSIRIIDPTRDPFGSINNNLIISPVSRLRPHRPQDDVGADRHDGLRGVRAADLHAVAQQRGHAPRADLHLPLRQRLLLHLQAGQEEERFEDKFNFSFEEMAEEQYAC